MNKNIGLGFGLVCFVALATGCTLSKETGTTTTTTSGTGGTGGGDVVDCDADNDGHTVMYVAECEGVGDNVDCNDLNGSIFPGQVEVCGDGIDNNCNGLLDENCVCQNGATQSCYTGSANTRNVGMCHDGMQTCVNNAWGACLGSVTPVSEVCGNATDENCNGQVNDGCGAPDADGDGDPDATDCQPNNPAVHHGAVEVCDGIDNNCVNGVDEGGVCGQVDSDGDGDPDVTDCAPHDASRHHGATEVCDGVDNDCDAQIDEGGVCAVPDADGDGDPDATDCMPNDPSVHHGAQEICGDGIDNNCSGQGDEGCLPVTVCYHLTPPAGTMLNVAQTNWWAPTEDDCIMTVFDGQNHVACPATYYAGTPVIFSADAMADGVFYHPFDTCGMPPGTQSVGSVWVTKGECADNGPGIWNTTTGPWQDNPDNLACTRNGYFIVPNP